jgi:hypothetical protein
MADEKRDDDGILYRWTHRSSSQTAPHHPGVARPEEPACAPPEEFGGAVSQAYVSTQISAVPFTLPGGERRPGAQDGSYLHSVRSLMTIQAYWRG